MLLAVIQHGVIVSRNRHNHFVDRIDRQLTVVNNKRHFLEVLVVIRELFSFQTHRVGARVGALRFRGAAKREVAFLVQLVVDRHVIARNRMLLAVIQHGVIVSRNRYNHFVRDRRDLQRSVDRLRNDILSCRVNRANRTIRKVCRIFANVRSLRANRDIAEIRAFRRTGKAGNALLLSIIRHSLALRRQLDVLIIVEIDLVRSLGDRDRLLFIRFRRNCVAFNRGGGCLHGTAKRRFFCLLSNRCVLIAHPIVVYRVVSNHRPHVFIIELYIFYRFVKIYLGVQIRIAFPFCF